MPRDGLMTLQVYSANGLDADIDGITALNVRLNNGALLGIRPGHERLIASCEAGELTYVRDNVEQTLAIPAGILTVRQDLIKILTSG